MRSAVATAPMSTTPATAASRARSLLAMRSVARVFYAIKANPHPALLQAIAREGLGFECVSRAEIGRVLQAVPGIARERLLFTPNFAPRDEYRWALESGIRVTVDNLDVLRSWTGLFRGREILLRLDTGHGHGHHEKVRTAGLHSKFGVPPEEFGELPQAAADAGATVVGLHAHAGSGHFEIAGWIDAARVLAAEAARFPEARVLNLGGGLGVPDRPGEAPFDLAAFDAALAEFRAAHPRTRAVDRTGAVRGGGCRCAARARDADQGQGGEALRGRRDRHEFTDPSRALRRLARDRQPDAPRRTRRPHAAPWLARSARAATNSAPTGCCRAARRGTCS